jgi:DNA-directed RNA polymerase specialized sigma24 family protein
MGVKVERALTPQGFERLLHQLDADREAAGRTYELLRRRLVRFFEGRRCAFPEEYADETLNRVARKLDAGEPILDVTTYVIGVARMVVKEAAKTAAKQVAAATAWPAPPHAIPHDASHADESVLLLDCLHACLDTLAASDRDLIVRYYENEKQARIRHRQQLAAGLGVEMNALRIRVFRIRTALESCVDGCAAASGPRNGMGSHAST